MKSLNKFIEEAAKSVKKPNCPEGSYYDPIKKKYDQKIDFGHPGGKNQEKPKKMTSEIYCFILFDFPSKMCFLFVF